MPRELQSRAILDASGHAIGDEAGITILPAGGMAAWARTTPSSHGEHATRLPSRSDVQPRRVRQQRFLPSGAVRVHAAWSPGAGRLSAARAGAGYVLCVAPLATLDGNLRGPLEIPTVGNADTLAYYAEAKYKFTPRFSGAVRWNQQLFGPIIDRGVSTRWGNDAWRIDVAPGFRFTPHTQLKFEYSLQNGDSRTRDYTRLMAVQLTVRF